MGRHAGGDLLVSPSELLVRTRLIELLRVRWSRRVTLVCAPAGFGKTTLLAQAMTINEQAPAGLDRWHGCTPADAAVSSLAEGLCPEPPPDDCADIQFAVHR